jgi:hypothetical protein
VPIDRDVLDAVLDMDEHDLRRVLILARARLECPHGPYWYATWSEDGKRRSRYVGKIDEESVNLSAAAAETASSGV